MTASLWTLQTSRTIKVLTDPSQTTSLCRVWTSKKTKTRKTIIIKRKDKDRTNWGSNRAFQMYPMILKSIRKFPRALWNAGKPQWSRVLIFNRNSKELTW